MLSFPFVYFGFPELDNELVGLPLCERLSRSVEVGGKEVDVAERQVKVYLQVNKDGLRPRLVLIGEQTKRVYRCRPSMMTTGSPSDSSSSFFSDSDLESLGFGFRSACPSWLNSAAVAAAASSM